KGQVKSNTPVRSAPSNVKGKSLSQKPLPASQPNVAKAKPAEIKKPVTSVKPKTQTAAKEIAKPTGSKISDVATKPSVSSKPNPERAKEQVKPKESQLKTNKPVTDHPVKSIVKMSDKKEFKPAVNTIAEEPHKSRYNDKELEEFDQLIDQKLIVAREQLEFYLKQLEDMAENPDNKIKGLDDGLSTLESERVSSMAARQQKLIQHLENAKIRIKNKVYGICRETGRLISKERLRAVPHATLSIEAKQAQN
ncbi:MAG: TraR/DksA C4-type zinc finger protein, partial [Saprospiraceae bacterium]